MKACETGKNRPNEKQIEQLKKIVSEIPSDEVLYGYSEILKAMADPTRLKILHLLKDGELCACEIISALEKPQPTVSHHLNILKNAGLLKWRKEGVWIHYKLSNPDMLDILKGLLNNE
ncbi:MAG TPA: metalloregulator ArsR/SmtB family transcription factor [Methanobacterium sp.]|nr:metalloregulator ArsR/SmtB family transcription factor [Methanobacterium sp.]